MLKGMFAFFDFETTGVNVNSFEYGDSPIEIGIVLTDEQLMIKDIYQSYIQWEKFKNWEHWPEDYQKAYEVHGIDLKKLKGMGGTPQEVVNELKLLLLNHQKNPKDKFTLVSDNAYFDTFMMHQLFNQADEDFGTFFHYTTWDINILCKATNTKKSKQHDHSALGDASNMHQRTLRCLEKINYFD